MMNLQELAFQKAKEIAERKEEILEAFVAKYGYDPDEMIIYEQPSHNRYWVEHRPKWISVNEKLPPSCKTVIACNVEKQVDACIFLHIDDKQFKQDYPCITHWMPLPSPPESE